MKFEETDSLVKRMVDTVGLPIYTFRKYVSSKTKSASQVVGIPWYTEDTWYKMKALADDKERFHATYQEWFLNTDKSIIILTNRGKLFERLQIDPLDYAHWCKQKSYNRNRPSRTAYTQYLLRRKLKQQM